jgi:Ser/Thr protein kinase RdoA (MazF antagonist)
MFAQLTYDQQRDQLATLARQASEHWHLPNPAITLAGYTNNAVFRVESGDDRYALRVHRPGHKPRAWIDSERAWLQALDATLRVPHPVGDVFSGSLPAYDGPVYASLATWIPGEPATLANLTPARLEAVGRLVAELHRTPFDAPPDFDRPTLDADGLFGPGGPYDPGDGLRYFDADALTVIDSAVEQVKAAMHALGSQSTGLIHADLIAKNILLDGDHIGLIDFDDCAYGYYPYDLTPLVWLARGTPQAGEIQTAIWRGYRAGRPAAQAEAEHFPAFLAARHIASCRWVAGNADHPALRGQVVSILRQRIDTLRVYLQTGTLSGDSGTRRTASSL